MPTFHNLVPRRVKKNQFWSDLSDVLFLTLVALLLLAGIVYVAVWAGSGDTLAIPDHKPAPNAATWFDNHPPTQPLPPGQPIPSPARN
jgi:hypothetical protein